MVARSKPATDHLDVPRFSVCRENCSTMSSVINVFVTFGVRADWSSGPLYSCLSRAETPFDVCLVLCAASRCGYIRLIITINIAITRPPEKSDIVVL